MNWQSATLTIFGSFQSSRAKQARLLRPDEFLSCAASHAALRHQHQHHPRRRNLGEQLPISTSITPAGVSNLGEQLLISTSITPAGVTLENTFLQKVKKLEEKMKISWFEDRLAREKKSKDDGGLGWSEDSETGTAIMFYELRDQYVRRSSEFDYSASNDSMPALDLTLCRHTCTDRQRDEAADQGVAARCATDHERPSEHLLLVRNSCQASAGPLRSYTDSF